MCLLIAVFWFRHSRSRVSPHLTARAGGITSKCWPPTTWKDATREAAGLKKAEAYVVGQLKAAGLQPAGVKGYYQPVKFESRQLVENESSAALVRDGKAEPLTLGEDAIFSTRVDLAPSVDAPLVFVGYGLSIPEKDFDDLAGLDLKGKVAVLITRLSLADSFGAGLAPSDCGGTLESFSRSGSGRDHLHPESRVHGCALGPHQP